MSSAPARPRLAGGVALACAMVAGGVIAASGVSAEPDASGVSAESDASGVSAESGASGIGAEPGGSGTDAEWDAPEACAEPDTSGKMDAYAYARYLGVARREGMVPRPGRALVLGIRGRDLCGRRHATRIARAYDDTLVVLTADRRVVQLAVSTHPWERASAGVPDVDGDGRADVGMIRPGPYLVVRRDAARDIEGAPTYHVRTAEGDVRLPGWRNTDQDDAFSDAERRMSEARGDTLTAVLFHQGGGKAPKAVGCQVLDARAMRRLARVVGERFDYLLVDAADAPLP